MEKIKAAVLANKKAIINYYYNMFNSLYVKKADYNNLCIECTYDFVTDTLNYKVFIYVANSDGNGSFITDSLKAYILCIKATEEEAVSEINNLASSAGNESE